MTAAHPGRPHATEHDPFFNTYLDLVHESDILAALQDQLAQTRELLRDVPGDQSECLHPPYTWTIKQVIGHCSDVERIFGYRAGRIATGDTTPLPGFDENAYAASADYGRVGLVELVQELEHTRLSNLAMLRRISPAAWDNRGTVDGKEISVRAIAYLLVGHLRHHLVIVKKRLA